MAEQKSTYKVIIPRPMSNQKYGDVILLNEEGYNLNTNFGAKLKKIEQVK